MDRHVSPGPAAVVPALAVMPVSGAEHAAATLAQRLQLPLLEAATRPATCESARALLLVAPGKLSLQLTGRGAPGPLTVDFGAPAMRHRRRGGHNELLGRAVGLGRKQALSLLDATAGLGRDGFVLADLGCQVILCERHPVVAALLSSGMDAARESGDPWLTKVIARMQLLPGDARELQNITADVIYLDPMFPPRDNSAAVKKEMALFQLLLEGVEDAGEGLLPWALGCNPARVVVKRALRAAPLDGRDPSHCISGKAVRYDVYVQRALA